MPEFFKHLKQERKRRGWSQADLASELQIETKTVSRWERGLQTPHPHYQQQLCKLFGKNAEELGLVEDDEQETANRVKNDEKPEQEEPEQKKRALVRREDWDEAPRLRHFYGRGEDLDLLVTWVEHERSSLIAVLGMGAWERRRWWRNWSSSFKVSLSIFSGAHCNILPL